MNGSFVNDFLTEIWQQILKLLLSNTGFVTTIWQFKCWNLIIRNVKLTILIVKFDNLVAEIDNFIDEIW